MISDIKKLLRSAADARKRIAELKKLNNKVTTLHRHTVFSLDDFGSEQSYPKNSIPFPAETQVPPYMFQSRSRECGEG
jgi:hypothetical protein